MTALLDPPGQFHPIWPPQCGAAVHPRGPSPLVDLRDPTGSDQRVRPGPQHQPLQAAHLAVLARPRRREDALPQAPYFRLGPAPVNLVPVLAQVPRSVHRHHSGGVQRPRGC
jgi:hypothetical protein